jgi:2-aminoadipate transaminase
MIQDLHSAFSVSAQNMKRSVIREVLKLTQIPDIISFAGGLPAPESFPIEDIKRITAEVLDKEGSAALQYGATEGEVGLRKILVERYRKQGLSLEMDNLVMLTSSQQGLSLLGKIFLDPEDVVLCGLPSYLGGISAFVTYGAKLKGIPFDEKGMRSDLLEEKLIELKNKGIKPKFIYLVPDFQNPAGITMPEKRRKEILDLAYKYDVLIIEDSPYRELRYDGKEQKMLYEMDKSGHVITLGTFSKTFVPGFRLGWVVADAKIIDKFVMSKQSADLCASPFLQKITLRYIEEGLYDENIKKTISNYRVKRDIMLKAFEDYMPEGVTWTKPEGGLFLFLNLPKHMDASDVFTKAIEKKVAFVIGSVFHCDGSGKNTIRMNFSHASREMNLEGVKRLAEVIKKEM